MILVLINANGFCKTSGKRVFDFIKEYKNADKFYEFAPQVGAFTSGGITKNAIFLHSTSDELKKGKSFLKYKSILLPDISTSEKLLLVFELGIKDGANFNDKQYPADGVVYSVEIDGRNIFTEKYKAQHWSPRIIDISKYKSGIHQVSLIVGKGENSNYDWALWGTPKICKLSEEDSKNLQTNISKYFPLLETEGKVIGEIINPVCFGGKGMDEIRTTKTWADIALIGDSVKNLYPKDEKSTLVSSGLPLSFIYDGEPSSKLLPNWKKTHNKVLDSEDKELHIITYTDPKTGLVIIDSITVFKKYPAIEWVAKFENQGNEDTPILEDLLSLDLQLKIPASRDAILHHTQGSQANTFADTTTLTGFDYQPYDDTIRVNYDKSFEPTNGQSSNKVLPFFNLEWNDGGLIWAIGWTGWWKQEVISNEKNEISITAGQKTIHLKLHPGESIRTPRMLLLFWQGNDRLYGHNQFRKLMLDYYLPRDTCGKLQMTPVTTMQIFSYGAKVNEKNSLEWIDAANKLGCEAFWVDAGWYDCPRDDIFYARGKWDPEPTRFPNGLKPLSDKCHNLGMKFLLWFDEEAVMQNSEIYKTVPKEWLLHLPGQALNDHEACVYNFSIPEARKWMTDYISKRIEKWGIDIYRHDCNIWPITFCLPMDTEERQGITENHYIEGLYKHWDELLQQHPGLLIDNCAGGGQRIDLEMMKRSLPLWQSDVNCFGLSPAPDLTYPFTNQPTMDQVQNAGLSYYIPIHAGGIWSANPYIFRSIATMGGVFNENVTDPKYDMELAKKDVEELKSLRHLWLGDYYPLVDINLDDTKWCAWQFNRLDLGEGFAIFFRRYKCDNNIMDVKLRGLDKDKYYTVDFVDKNEQKVMMGIELENLKVEITGKPGSLLIKYKQK
jgi:alpha-galactosidase